MGGKGRGERNQVPPRGRLILAQMPEVPLWDHSTRLQREASERAELSNCHWPLTPLTLKCGPITQIGYLSS